MKKIQMKDFVFLHISFLIYTISMILSKLAAKQEFLSLEFIVLYGLVVLVLFIYAVLWQQTLKKMPLTLAYANKAIVVIWGLFVGNIIFNEQIRLNMLLGAGIIILGIYLVVTGEEN